MATPEKLKRYQRMSLLANAKERNAGIALAQINTRLHQEKQRLEELQGYLQSHDEKLTNSQRQTSVNLHNRRLFLGKLQKAIRAQSGILSQLGRRRASLLEHWQSCHQEKRLYEKLEEKQLRYLQSVQRHTDAKNNDEVSALQHFRKGD